MRLREREALRRARLLGRVARLLTLALAAVMVGVAPHAVAQAGRIPTPGRILFPWQDHNPTHSYIYVKWPGESDARLVHDEPGLIWHAKWSPDGELIAFANNIPFVNDDTLSVMNADGSDVRILVDGIVVEDDAHTWGPGDRQLTYYENDGNWDGDLWVIDVDGPLNQRRLTRDGGVFVSPAWSPDRQRIAYSWGPHNLAINLYVMDADGGGVTQLTRRGGARQAAWSPDGSQLVYAAIDEGVVNDLFVVDARQGAVPRRLTQEPYWKHTPTFLADGQWIAYSVYDVYVVSVDGEAPHKLGVRKDRLFVTRFDWYDPFRAVSGAGKLPSRWVWLKASGE